MKNKILLHVKHARSTSDVKNLSVLSDTSALGQTLKKVGSKLESRL